MSAPQLAMAQFMDINAIISGIGSLEYLDEASRADDASDLRVVRLSSLAGAEMNAARLQRAVALKWRAVGYLQSNLVINPQAMTSIRNAGFSVEQIVSVHVSGDGGGVMYANDL
jgi:hypothetical protein